MLRAFGALERDPTVRNPDFLARAFLADARTFRLMLRLGSPRALHACGRWAFEQMGPGTYWMETARVKHFDSVLLDEVSKGVRQVIVLGAGLDTRAYRFSSQLTGVRLIEVDQPAMTARKRERVQAVFGAPPPHVTYLPLDLAARDLGEALAEAGFEPSAPVLVLWVGVSMYLPEEVVGSTLRWVAGRAEGSSIAFDYLDRQFFDDEKRFSASWRMRRMIELSGERLVYGLDRASVPALMRDHGLAVRSHLAPPDLAAKYLWRSNGKMAGRLSPHFGFVHAG